MGHWQRRLTAVMFTDIVGYSALVHADEPRARRLLEMHRHVVRGWLERYGGRIGNTMGDGLLITFPAAVPAIECAVEIQTAFAQLPSDDTVKLRIAIHLGDVEAKDGRLFGDGVNVGARLEPLAPPGGIAVSSVVLQQVHNAMRGHFVSRGLQQLKNIAEPVEVHVLDAEGVAAIAAILSPPPAPRLTSRHRRWLAGGAAAAVGAVVLAAVLLWPEQRGAGVAGGPEAADDRRGVAVLPLDNLSTAADSENFTAGLHDSLLTELSRVPKLKVISRSSVMRYAKERPALTEIGRALKISHVIEGSVQRQGARVRVNVQLIDAQTDEHVWAKIYDRDIADLFAIQTEISREISREVGSNLAPQDAPGRPTQSVEAYDLYLTAIGMEQAVDIGKKADKPIGMLEQAVKLDPQFAQAWAALSRIHNLAFFASGNDRSGMHDEGALQSAEMALKLQPDLPEAQIAMGRAVGGIANDKAKSREYLEAAVKRLPGSASAHEALGRLNGTVGRMDEALTSFRTALGLNPGNETLRYLTFASLENLHRYEETDRELARWLEVASDPHDVRRRIAELRSKAWGRLEDTRALVRDADASGDKEWMASLDYQRAWLVAVGGNFEEAARQYATKIDAFVSRGEGEWGDIFTGCTYRFHAGDRAGASACLKAIHRAQEKELAGDPDNINFLNNLALTEAFLGDATAALTHAGKAEARAAAVPGYFDQMNARRNYALVAALVGRPDEAFSRLEIMLRPPSNLHAHDVAIDPDWSAIRSDPRWRTVVEPHLKAPPPAYLATTSGAAT